MNALVHMRLCWQRHAMALLMVFVGLLPAFAAAHETLPAALRMDETATGVFAVVWRLPATQGSAPEIQPVLPDGCLDLTERLVSQTGGAQVWRWQVRCSQGLAGQRIVFLGQENYLIDAVVRVSRLDTSVVTLVARPRAPAVVFDAQAQAAQDVRGFFRLGVEHILGGVDHLLFVFCLLLWVKRAGPLLRTITGFTLGHSITLALATLGVVRVPGPPVEACIALSILFLAGELARRGPLSAASAAGQRPWMVAAVFGLLHGFGFAGALSAVGLPTDGLALALLNFNLGVEAGQLGFVAVVWGAMAWLHRARLHWPWTQAAFSGVGQRVAAYGAGTLSAFWLLQRLVVVAGLASQ